MERGKLVGGNDILKATFVVDNGVWPHRDYAKGVKLLDSSFSYECDPALLAILLVVLKDVVIYEDKGTCSRHSFLLHKAFLDIYVPLLRVSQIDFVILA